MRHAFFFALLLTSWILPLLGPYQLAAQEQRPRYSLTHLIQLTRSNRLNLDIDDSGERQALAQKKQVAGEFGLKIEGLLGAGPAKAEQGNALVSHTTDDWGPAYIGQLSATYPIFTWGRQRNYLRALDQAIEAERGSSNKKEIDLIYQLKEAYWGLLYANTLLDFIGTV